MQLTREFKRLDSSDMFGHIYHFPEQMEEAIEIGRNLRLSQDYSTVNSIVFSGMGGSAIGTDIVTALTTGSSTVPMIVIRNYSLPNWVSDKTLVICVSHSGNTEETLSCYKDAISRNAKVIGVTSGGELKQRMTQNGGDFIEIPGGYPPRASLCYLAVPIFFLLYRIGVLTESKETELTNVVAHLAEWRNLISRDKEGNPTFEVAKKIHDSIPVIYGQADGTNAVALRWREQLEENGKIVAFHHMLPEMNHNEIVGFDNNPELLKQLGVIWLIDKDDHVRTRKRQELTRDIIGETVKYQLEIESEGNSIFERFFYLIYFGDWVSFWVAMLHGTDPTPVKKIDMLKSSISC